MLVPVATPIVYARREAFPNAFGEIKPTDPNYAALKQTLDTTVV